MIKQILIGDEAKKELKEGINSLADIVEVTLGPQGQYVILDKNYILPHTTKDGVSVAREINLEKRVPNIGCSMIKNVAHKTAEEAGDGTTTSIVIARNVFIEGLKEIQENGTNAIEVQRGMYKAVKDIVEQIKTLSLPISSEQDLINVATISANGDTETGSLIGSLVYKIGSKGNIIVKDSYTYDTSVEYVDGIKYDAGYLSYHFCNDLDNQRCSYDNPLILVSLEKIVNWQVLEPFVRYAMAKDKPLVIFADEMVGEALAFLTANVVNKGLKVCAVRAPGFANNRREIMEDICYATGASLIGNDTGNPFNEVIKNLKNGDSRHLGTADSIIIDRNSTTFFVPDSHRGAINNRIQQIESHKLLNEGKAVKAKFDERVAILNGQVAIVYVGGVTDAEIKEKKDRIDDAIRASQAALEEGIVEGSGMTYMHAIFGLDSHRHLTQDEYRGYNIVISAVRKVFTQIAKNAGIVPDVILNNISKYQQEGTDITGYNFITNKYVNLIEDGVIDPAKVLRVALENAVSVSSLLLASGGIVYNKLTDLDVAALARPQMQNHKSYE